jgi:hypothetical protein
MYSKWSKTVVNAIACGEICKSLKIKSMVTYSILMNHRKIEKTAEIK